MSDIINKDRFNKFNWSPKLSRQKLIKLYKSDANGFQDEDIDRLIHEFHINLNSGVKGRFVAINLIQGTKKQIGDLIISLAYE
jgi:hypothetical protein